MHGCRTIPIGLGNVVKASNHCQAYFMSIMYLELWTCNSNPIPSDAFRTHAKTVSKDAPNFV